MHKVFAVLLLLAETIMCYSRDADSLLNALQGQKDTARIFTLMRLSGTIMSSSPEKALQYAQEAYALSEKSHFELGRAQSLNVIANISYQTGNLLEAIKTQFQVLRIQESLGDSSGIAASYNTIALVYQKQRDFVNATAYFKKARSIFEFQGQKEYVLITLMNIGDNYEQMNRLDSALYFQNAAYQMAVEANDKNYLGTIHINLGNIELKLGESDIALSHYKASIPLLLEIDDVQSLSDAYYGMAQVLRNTGNADAALTNAKKSYEAAQQISFIAGIQTAATLLSELFDKANKIDSAYRYHKIAMTAKDSLFNEEIIRQVQTMSIDEKLREQQLLESAARQIKERRDMIQWTGIGLFILLFFMLLAFLSKMKSKHKSLKYLGLLALLLFFEFISLIIHPTLARLTHHIPVFIFLVTVTIAALLIPVHHKLERYVEMKLSGRKKRVRRTSNKLPVKVISDGN